MIRHTTTGLRARHVDDVPVLHAQLYDDVVTRSRGSGRAWTPISPGSAASPFAVADPSPEAAPFSVVDLSSGELLGEAILWGIDTHNRSAHVGLALLPAARGQGRSGEVVDLLCGYAFRILGLRRVQVETLADNSAMLRSAERAGFVEEGRRRQAAWADGSFVDEVVLGQLAHEWLARQDERLS